MKIIETGLSFGSMSVRSKTNRIIVHHAAAKTASASDIHRWHKQRGWAGAGYHFLVRKDGSVYRLRPEKYVGAHASGSNSDSLGICFEGDFEKETMGTAQKNSGKELVAYLKKRYGISKVQRHKDVGSTSCPGKNFPFSEIAGASGNVSVEGGGTSGSTGAIKVDGWWGKNTTKALQNIFDTGYHDGIVSNQDPAQKRYLERADSGSWDFKGQGNGSNLIGAIQNWVGVDDDGFMGPKTIRALQSKIGANVDSFMGYETVTKLQEWINKQIA